MVKALYFRPGDKSGQHWILEGNESLDPTNIRKISLTWFSSAGSMRTKVFNLYEPDSETRKEKATVPCEHKNCEYISIGGGYYKCHRCGKAIEYYCHFREPGKTFGERYEALRKV